MIICDVSCLVYIGSNVVYFGYLGLFDVWCMVYSAKCFCLVYECYLLFCVFHVWFSLIVWVYVWQRYSKGDKSKCI